ncbi:MAG: bifunctional DNA-formamidopyrimidine glycosylase/DNA-(apurinic or apyrimidinic site) lyase [bacterium]
MPELPEVQTIVSELNKKIKNKTIKIVVTSAVKSALPSAIILARKLKNKKIYSIGRRGKMIIIDLGGDHNILIHLKMTGQLVYASKSGQKISGGHAIGNVGELPNKFSRIVIDFTDGSALYFNDIRKFGWIKYVDNATRELTKQKYGVEPFDKEYRLSWFLDLLKKYKNKKIKQLLLDQEKIAGIGNIYADESLFMAHILPTRIAGDLKEKEVKDLYLAIPKILKFAITKGGTTSDNYVRTDGTKGGMLKYLKVYKRAGQKCLRCNNVIKKIKLGGRGTHFCPDCQK